jgi:hypothetical protein
MGDDAAELVRLERLAEEAYDAMYEARFGVSGHYSDAKEFLHDAIGLAGRLGDTASAERLRARLAHIQAVFRSQFTG